MDAPALEGAGAPRPCDASYWRLSPSVTACLAADRVLFLDLSRDRYLALPKELTRDFLSWLDEPGKGRPSSFEPLLASLGIPERAAPGLRPARCLVERPIALDPEPLPRSRLRARDILGVGQAVVSAARDVRSRPLSAILKRRFGRLTAGAALASGLEQRLAVFRSARPLIPVARVCLHDCLALIDWLGPDAGGAALVFGVSAYPFAAHCWVQAGERVVDDHPESPSRFQPILRLP